MSTLTISRTEGEGLAMARRAQALATTDQLRLLAAAVLGFLLVDYARLSLVERPTNPVGAVMDVITYVSLLVMLWRPRLGLALAAIPLTTALVMTSTSMEAPLLVAVAALGCAQLARREAIALSASLAVFVGVRTALHPAESRPALLVVLGLATALGLALGWALLTLRERHDRALATSLERARSSARLRADERAAISRELHDVVVHKLSNISLQVMGSTHSDDPDELHDVLETIGQANAEALTDLRLLMDVLRDRTLEASPGVELQELTQRVPPTLRAASAELELVRAGFEPDVMVPKAADELPMTVQNTISRVLAEATANVIAHAPRKARCLVRVRVGAQAASVEVRNPVPDDLDQPSLGWGLASLRERIALTGGEFGVAVTDGEWVVQATLPLG